MNYKQSKVMNWGIKALTLVVLTVTMYSVANGQVEIEKLKNQTEERKEAVTAEAKVQPVPWILPPAIRSAFRRSECFPSKKKSCGLPFKCPPFIRTF